MARISDIKKKSGAASFASILGKSTIPKDHLAYRAIEQAVEILIKNDYGIIHGGYSGGAMSAASDAANRMIAEFGLQKERNIAVPQKERDGMWERVMDADFTDAAEDIFARLKVILSGDIAVVCPLGGDGTELEETLVFHENVIRDGVVRRLKEKSVEKSEEKIDQPIPLIFLQIPGGTDWRKLIETKMTLLDTRVRDPIGYSWLYFVDSMAEFETLIARLSILL